jgi:Uma2 family endonuclease
MKPLIETPPRTMMEVYKSLPEGTLAELIDNQLYMSPSPAFNHQDILIEIASQLRSKLRQAGAKIAVAPFDIYLDETMNAVQPDIVVILKDNTGTLNLRGHFHGVPDIVAEILSPHNREHDLVRKKELYRRFGVKEYWIIDPESKKVTVLEWIAGKYIAAVEQVGSVKSKFFPESLTF